MAPCKISRLVAVIGTLLLSAFTVHAQLPSQEQITADLSGKFSAVQANPVRNHRGALMQELEPLLMQQARYLVSLMHPWEKDEKALLITEGKNASEHQVRPNAHTALGLAILYRVAPDEAFDARLPKSVVRDRTLGLLHLLLQTHGAGGIGLGKGKGKTWRKQWQSALWAEMAGQACWLLWDDLTPSQKWLAARMICDEADRFINARPPAQVRNDTKAEENAWNSLVISLAYNMFPKHPNRALWKEAAIRWKLSSFATKQDTLSDRVVDGKPLRDRLTGANIHDDYTLENHDRVHPDYMTTTTMLSYQIPLYTWAGNPVPEAVHYNVEKIYANMKHMALPDGGWVYPNGQDWQLHRNVDWIQYNAAAAVLYNDPQAAALSRLGVETMRRMAARNPEGPVLLLDESRFGSSQPMILEWPSQAYMLMAQLGEGPAPTPLASLWKELSSRQVFETGKFGILRTEKSIATFSWGAQVMGMVMPLREDQLLNPHLRGLIGYMRIPGPKREAPRVREISVLPSDNVLGVSGVLDRGNGLAEQRFAFLALPDGRTIYADILRLAGTNKPVSLEFCPLGILNDTNWPWHSGRRTLAYEGGTKVFAAANAATDEQANFKSPWYNLDGLGILCLAASGGQQYSPQPTHASCRLEQMLFLNVVPPASFAAAAPGSLIAHGVFVFYPGHSVEQTRAAAAQCTLRSTPGSEQIQLMLEDGTLVSLDLKKLTIQHTAPSSGK